MEFVIGPFIGVIGAFITQWVLVMYRNWVDRKKLKENIRDELSLCNKLLIRKGNLVPTSMWHSTVATGDLKLLTFSQRSKLSKLYFEIDNFNYEAKRVRDSAVMANVSDSEIVIDGKTPAMVYWQRLSGQLVQMEVDLKNEIAKLLRESWL